MLIFSDWIIKTDGELIARQYDNLTRELLVTGDLPEGWAWELLVQAGGSVNVIALAPREEGVGVTLTAEMLTKAGLYALQLRGGRGEEVRHTNVIQVVVPTSLVGDGTWPELPSEFSQAEANIRALNAHPPIPGDGGYWLLWDLEAEDYAESQLPLPDVSVGPPGPQGEPGPQGPRVKRGKRATRATPARRAHKVQKATRATPARRVPRAPRATPAPLAPRVSRGHRGKPDHRAPRATPETPGPRDRRARTVRRVSRGPRERRGRKAPRALPEPTATPRSGAWTTGPRPTGSRWCRT